MYTMVLMMAVSTGGDVSSFGFGHHRSGCNGASACHGTVVAAPAGCTGHVDASAGCSGSCHGAKKGFLSGLFSHHKKSSCHGAVVAAPACDACPPVVAGPPTGTPPVIMPKVEDPKPKPKTEDKPKDKTESN